MTGTLLGKRYELTEKIDSGGMADIYKALCKKTGSIVAVKVLKECFSDDKEYVDRFKKEAEAVFALDHQNIVRVTDIGYDEDAYYMVMEYVDGSTLKAQIDKRKPLGEKEVVEYALQVCSALSAAHKKGIIHRDIKPHNVLLDKDGNVKLTDFGIAKSVTSREENENQVIGSVYYISPEQARGEKADARSDIYSLGIMMYEMITGVLPHTGEKTVSVALKHINEQITPPDELNPGISKSLNNIILKATCKSKKDRYQSAADLKKDLVKSLADPEGAVTELPAACRNANVNPEQIKKNMLLKFGMLFLLVALMASLVTAGILIFGNAAKEAFVVPDLVGLNIDSVSKRLGNLTVNTTYEPSESADEGVIISQSPEAGSNSAGNASITLTISSGPIGPVMPNLAGMPLEEALALIASMGIELREENIDYEYYQEMPSGIIIIQTPEAGEPVTRDSILSLIVSDQNEQSTVMMPDLTNRLADQAVSYLKDNGFGTCFVYEDEYDLPEGTVKVQFPEKGIQTAYTQAVTLSISKYKTRYYAELPITGLSITEKESKVKIVVREMINGQQINLVTKEMNEGIGKIKRSIDIDSISRGKKIVVVYVNNVEAQSYEVNFS